MSHARTRMVRFSTVALASGAALGALSGAGAAGATATPPANSSGGASAVPTTLAGVKAKAATDITNRVNALNAAIAKVNAAKSLGGGQATLASYLGTDIGPLQQLNQTIQGDSTLQEATHDFGTIFTGYRVYRLVLPAARIDALADSATSTGIPKLTADAAKAQAHVTSANQATVQPLINDLNSQITTATNATNGLAGTVVAFTPAQWNANTALLNASISSAQTAKAALQKGRSDLRQIVQDLKAGRAADGSTTTTG